MTAIWRATDADTERIVEMGAKLHASGPYADVPYNPDATAEFVAGILAQGAVFMTDDGMCGGAIFPFYLNPDFKMATEFFWWAPKDGRRLREAFEVWAVEQGASAVQFSALTNERLPAVTRIYRGAGFRPAETAFVKRLA